MMSNKLSRPTLLLLAVSLCAPLRAAPPEVFVAPGMCDGSAAVALDENLYLVANDEDNRAALFDRRTPGRPIGEAKDLSGLLRVEEETDLEGATRIGDVVYWIGSHARNKKGEKMPDRRRLLATRVQAGEDDWSIEAAGEPYDSLLKDLTKDDRLEPFDLKAASKKPPKTEGALDIEGLSASPEGWLLVAFRNPVIRGKALVVPITNPAEVTGSGARAELGNPILLDLGGLGIRSMEYWPERKSYVIVAGPWGSEGEFRVFSWSGKAKEKPAPMGGIDLDDLRPESLALFPGDADQILLFSDDGAAVIGDTECKDLDEEDRTLRGAFFSPTR